MKNVYVRFIYFQIFFPKLINVKIMGRTIRYRYLTTFDSIFDQIIILIIFYYTKIVLSVIKTPKIGVLMTETYSTQRKFYPVDLRSVSYILELIDNERLVLIVNKNFDELSTINIINVSKFGYSSDILIQK